MQDLPAQLIPKLAVGPLSSQPCPSALAVPRGLRALKFIMGVWEPQGWEGTSHEMEEWDVRAWHGTGWVADAGGGRNNLKSQLERPVLPGQEAEPKERGSRCWESSGGVAAAQHGVPWAV